MKNKKAFLWSKNNHCNLCQHPTSNKHICSACLADLPWLDTGCPRCALPYPTKSMQPCGNCLRDPKAFDQIIAACHYRFPIDQLISQLKYHQRPQLTPLLCQLFTYRLQAVDTFPELLIPVPMHWRKLQHRGFNQAYLIAQYLSKQLNIPIAEQTLIKTRSTEQQRQLSRQQRQKNLRGSFSLHRTLPKHVAVVDDVMTTGTTMHEIALLLKNHQVERVDGWVIARTPR